MDIEQSLKHFRPNVGIVLFNQEAKVWLGQRVMGDVDTVRAEHRWQFPQGGIDDGEDVEAAAFRELKEETAISSADMLLLTPGWLTYDFPPEHKKKKWKGQRQKWAAMLFRGHDDEVDLTADDYQEFDDWRWAELEEAPALIVPFKRAVYQDLVRALVPLRDFLRQISRGQ